MKRVLTLIIITVSLLSIFIPATTFAGNKKTIYIPIRETATHYGDETVKEVFSYKVNKKGQYKSIRWKSYNGLYRETCKPTYNKKNTAIKKMKVLHYKYGVFDEQYINTYYYKNGLITKCKVDGILDSILTYNKKGRLKKITEYKNGKYNGKSIYTIAKNGYREQTKYYNKNNILKNTYTYKYEFKNGVVVKRYVFNKKTGEKEDAYTYKYKKFKVSSRQYKILKNQLKNWYPEITK